ncbi:MAG: hypothetical protein HOI66_22455 [Verrucomicrobia bacterium]|jgi:hypothetical protein|nr:hypothetical protein [Verrucomicrobiota bacterium]
MSLTVLQGNDSLSQEVLQQNERSLSEVGRAYSRAVLAERQKGKTRGAFPNYAFSGILVIRKRLLRIATEVKELVCCFRNLQGRAAREDALPTSKLCTSFPAET